MVTLQAPSPVRYAAAMDVGNVPAFAVRETDQTGPPKPRLLDRVREAIRTRHYSRRTEKAYVAWIRRALARFVTRRGGDSLGGRKMT